MNKVKGYVLVRSKKRPSVFSATNVSVSSSSLPLSSSSSDSSAPRGLAFVPSVAGAFGDAKLVRPPGFVAPRNPLPTPENPLPRTPKPELPAGGPKLDKPVVGLKTDEADAPRAANGELADVLANALVPNA